MIPRSHAVTCAKYPRY